MKKIPVCKQCGHGLNKHGISGCLVKIHDIDDRSRYDDRHQYCPCDLKNGKIKKGETRF